VREGGRRFGSIELLVYDMLNGTIRKLAEYTDQPPHNISIMGYGRYLYYYIPHLNELDNGIMDRFVYYRADAVTGEIIELPLHGDYTSDNYWEYPRIWRAADNKLYWIRSLLESRTADFYITDLEGNNKETDESGILPGFDYHEGYQYLAGMLISWEEFEQFDASSYERLRGFRERNLRRRLVGANPGEPVFFEVIAESIVDYILHGDKIYFTRIEDEPEIIEYNGAQIWNWSGGKIWVMNLDGTDKRLLADTGYNFSFFEFVEAKTINGVDYIAWSFDVPGQMLIDGVMADIPIASPDTIIINGSTGEWVVLSAPE
jgi:hypothetical protein